MPTKIPWTDETWNTVTGCTPASEGCAHCYAKTMTKRLQAMGQRKYAAGFDTVVCHKSELDAPLHWKKPRMVFVNSMSDTFHKDVPFEFQATIFGIIETCYQHQFLFLTKRPRNMAQFFKRLVDQATKERYLALSSGLASECAAKYGIKLDYKPVSEYYRKHDPRMGKFDIGASWPIPNLWLGATAENQKWADERIWHLIKIPASIQFLSLEPLLGPIYLNKCWICKGPDEEGCFCEVDSYSSVKWVIVGAESGPGARECKIEWVESIVEQCQSAGVPIFVKQIHINGRLVRDIEKFPAHLQLREYPEGK